MRTAQGTFTKGASVSFHSRTTYGCALDQYNTRLPSGALPRMLQTGLVDQGTRACISARRMPPVTAQGHLQCPGPNAKGISLRLRHYSSRRSRRRSRHPSLRQRTQAVQPTAQKFAIGGNPEAFSQCTLSSRPEEFHLRALPTGSSCFRLANGQTRTTEPLRSSPITGPSTLLRTAPPLRLALGLSPSRLEPLAACPFTSST